MAPSLPRRALLGVQLGEDPHPDAPGLHVAGVVVDTMAAAAGLRAGDRLLAVNDAPVNAPEDARQVARGLDAARAWIAFRRDGVEARVEVPVSRRPGERLAGADTRYGHVVVDGRRLRTLRTSPADARPPGVFVVQGIARTSVDFATQPDAPLARLIEGLTRAGFATMRVEKWGVGDSEGEAEDADLTRELGGLEAGLDALAEHAEPLVGFGHSLGGMELPLLRRPLAGAVLYGSSARPWSECMEASARRQLTLRGADEARVEEEVARLREVPPHGVTERFVAQLEAAELYAAWARFEAPVLAIHGGLDWVVSYAEQEEIAEAAPRGRALAIDGVDHAFGRHDSVEASLRDYGRGAPDREVLDATVRFLRGILSGEGTR